MPMDVHTHQALGLDQPTPKEVNGHSNGDIIAALSHVGDAPYHPCPEAYPTADVAAGKVTKFADWNASMTYAGTVRDVAVYTPPTCDLRTPLRLLVCNDGLYYLNRSGPTRVTQVLDSLHACNAIEPTAAVFVDPGRPPGSEPMRSGAASDAASIQRSFEYDSLTPDYGDFICRELLPFVAGQLKITFSGDPTHRTICGISSGGICAFTVAWQHPAQFGRVLSHCGSFTNIRGGHNYPYLIRSTPRKPMRIFLQSGANDAATLYGDWPLANQTMANALAYAGYDYRFEFGNGGHSLRHGGAIFADSLRWLWR